MQFTHGWKFGMLQPIEQVPTPTHVKNKSEIYALFLCDCGKTKVINYRNVYKGKQKSCGCLRVGNPKHGFCLRSKKMYNSYVAMMSRCYDETHPEYSNYGGRGIIVCDSWFDVSQFFTDMQDSHQEDLSLDRIDVNGNYCKDNCQWADNSWQGFNKRLSTQNTSGKTGVSWCKERGKWESFITINRKKISLGRYDNYEDAVKAREQAELEYFGRLKGN